MRRRAPKRGAQGKGNREGKPVSPPRAGLDPQSSLSPDPQRRPLAADQGTEVYGSALTRVEGDDVAGEHCRACARRNPFRDMVVALVIGVVSSLLATAICCVSTPKDTTACIDTIEITKDNGVHIVLCHPR